MYRYSYCVPLITHHAHTPTFYVDAKAQHFALFVASIPEIKHIHEPQAPTTMKHIQVLWRSVTSLSIRCPVVALVVSTRPSRELQQIIQMIAARVNMANPGAQDRCNFVLQLQTQSKRQLLQVKHMLPPLPLNMHLVYSYSKSLIN